MKSRILIFTFLVLAAVTAAGMMGGYAIYHADKQEIKRVQNIAGAVITRYPSSEQTFVKAVLDNDRIDEDKGADIMAGYGYDYDMPVKNEYKTFLYLYSGSLLLIFLTFIGFAAYIVLYMVKKHEKQEETVLYMLDSCLSGNYDFAEDDDLMEKLQEPRFADYLTKLAQSLKLKTERLEEEQNNTKVMVTDISHQLKTPVSAMKVCLDMCAEAEGNEEKMEFLDRSITQMNRLETLSEALINISRLENKMIVIDRQKVMLRELLIDAVNMEYHKASAKDMEIEVEEFDDIMLELDRRWTVEAIANVIDNGIKYSPAGNIIKIRVSKLFSFVRIEIEDRGIGVPREERNRIFSRFFRGSNEAVRHQEGSGVGLYLSRKILEDQGGTISVKSAKQKGSVFIIQLPL